MGIFYLQSNSYAVNSSSNLQEVNWREVILKDIRTQENFKISDFSDKPVLLESFAVWCPTCTKQQRIIKDLHDEIGVDRGIPALAEENINFVSVSEADKWIEDNELVLVLEYKGVERVYPLQILVWYEIANDVVAGDNMLITYCPLCGSGIAYLPLIEVDGEVKVSRFGTSGKLYNSNLVMYDELTDTYWQQIDGKAIIGEDFDQMEMEEEEFKLIFTTTPELYAGDEFAILRGQNIGNEGGFKDDVRDYSFPLEIGKDVIYLDGSWKGNSDSLESISESKLILFFCAASVNIVINSLEGEVEVFLDGEYISEEMAGEDVIFSGGRSFIKIDNPRLYNIVDGEYGRSLLELRFDDGMKFSAFTFG